MSPMEQFTDALDRAQRLYLESTWRAEERMYERLIAACRENIQTLVALARSRFLQLRDQRPHEYFSSQSYNAACDVLESFLSFDRTDGEGRELFSRRVREFSDREEWDDLCNDIAAHIASPEDDD